MRIKRSCTQSCRSPIGAVSVVVVAVALLEKYTQAWGMSFGVAKCAVVIMPRKTRTATPSQSNQMDSPRGWRCGKDFGLYTSLAAKDGGIVSVDVGGDIEDTKEGDDEDDENKNDGREGHCTAEGVVDRSRNTLIAKDELKDALADRNADPSWAPHGWSGPRPSIDGELVPFALECECLGLTL